MSDIIVAVVGLITTIITSLGVFVFTRKRYKTETKHSELDNVDKAISIWRNLAQELKEEQKKMEKEIGLLRERIREIEEGFLKKCESCKYRKYFNEHKKPE